MNGISTGLDWSLPQEVKTKKKELKEFAKLMYELTDLYICWSFILLMLIRLQTE